LAGVNVDLPLNVIFVGSAPEGTLTADGRTEIWSETLEEALMHIRISAAVPSVFS
jgi:hypothetical protein